MCDACKIRVERLLDRLREVEPSLDKKISLDLKRVLTAEERARRVDYCQLMIQLLSMQCLPNLQIRQLIIYIDKKLWYLQQQGPVKVWGLEDPIAREAYGGSPDPALPISHWINKVNR